MIEWFKAGAVPTAYPPTNRTENQGASLIVVRNDRTVWKFESSPVPFRVEGDFCAFVCGDESALIAMDCGKSAREAVEITSRYNTGCGNGIDTLELE